MSQQHSPDNFDPESALDGKHDAVVSGTQLAIDVSFDRSLVFKREMLEYLEAGAREEKQMRLDEMTKLIEDSLKSLSHRAPCADAASVSILDPSSLELSRSSSVQIAQQSSELIDFPKLWERFSFCLSKQTRSEAFSPAFEDLKEDYLLVRSRYGRQHKSWFDFAFTLRTVWMVLDCFRVAACSGTAKTLFGVLPEGLRRYWRSP